MAVFTPQFEVHPHGVDRIGDKTYAVFKMIVSYKQPENDTDFVKSDFDDFRKAVDVLDWFYEYRNGVLELSNTASGLQQPTVLQFRFKFGSLPTAFKSKFEIGKQHRSIDVPLDAFSFLNTGSFYLKGTKTETVVPTKQMSSSPVVGLSDDPREKKRDAMYAVLKEADLYHHDHKQAKFNRAAAVGNKLNFSAIWASVMNEPVCAEERMGLIREFLIPIDKFSLSGTVGQFSYSIVCPETAGTTRDKKDYTTKGFQFIRRNGKFYNGREEKFLRPDRFKAVEPCLFDPLKEVASDDKTKHPDGIYVVVEYKKKNGANEDEEAFSDEDVKGYRVVAFDQKNYYSLSLHDKQLRYASAGGKRMLNSYSGLIHPKADLMTGNTNYRANLLFAWRGDNLSVNRAVEVESDEAQLQNKGFTDADADDCKEDAFVTNKIFTAEENLIAGSQRMLDATKSYNFFVRTASLTEHSLPLHTEITDDVVRDYTLTLEDLEPGELISFVSIDLNKKWVTPIKAPIIRLDKNDEKRQDHLIRSDKSDNYNFKTVFPPHIKWEDCKALGMLAPDKLAIDVKGRDGMEEYVWKCGQLEERVKSQAEYEPTDPVNYLADTRATNIEVLAADFEAYQAAPGLFPVPAFSFGSTYPYYSNTYPRNIVVEKTNGKKTFYVNKADGKPFVINADMKPGIYRFHVMSNETPRRRTEVCARENLDIVITDSPPPPEVTDKMLPVAQRFRANAGSDTKNDNFYYHYFKINNPDKALGSIKFLQQTDVLKLRSEQISNDILPGRQALLDNEFPYEFFIQKEGSIGKGGDLIAGIFPQSVSLRIELPESFFTAGDNFFTWTVGKYKLIATLDNADNKKAVVITARSLASHTDGEQPDLVIGRGKKLLLTCTIDPASKQHVLHITGDTTATLPLKDFISAESSVRDIMMEPAMVNKLSEAFSNTCFLTYRLSDTYCMAADLKNPYYAKKQIALFGSSAFQLYFNDRNEFDLGAIGSDFALEIPNNSPPTPPVAEADVLDSLAADDEWHSGGFKEYKQSYRKNLIRIKLSEDFMKEGPNRLGLVLSATGQGAERDPNVSHFGDDITRLSADDWSKETLKAWIDFAQLRSSAPSDESKSETALLAKYVDAEMIRSYRIGLVTYEVLLLSPYYNAPERCWQVVVPFKNLLSAESFFFKFAMLKVCRGHGLTKDPADANVFIDSTGTNLSAFGEPVQVPVFAKKKTELNYFNSTNEYHLLIESQSKETEKFYAIIGLTTEEKNTIINRRTAAGSMEMSDYGMITSLELAAGSTAQLRTGKILLFRQSAAQRPPIRFKAEHSIRRLWVLEFETHDNAPSIFEPGVTQKFYNGNILFEQNGIRLINMSSFRTK